MAQQPDYLSILQITDMHILADPAATMLGVNTAYYFNSVLESAFAAHHHFDLILVTGDLAQEPCEESYRYILNSLKAHNVPCICLPGNHDDAELMQQILNTDQINCRKQLFLGNWQIISLNSQIPDSPGGYLSNEELSFLDDCLNGNPDYYALIAVHHHCISSKSPWMDTMMIKNGHELLAIVKQYPQAKVIINGHIHQVMDSQSASVRVLGTPSTCFQFEPGSTEFSLDTTASPAYRLIRLYGDGLVESGIVRLPGRLSGLQTGTEGY